ncbi:hypothetical protein Ancab_033939 [Ancistrocladus abbreviatus]
MRRVRVGHNFGRGRGDRGEGKEVGTERGGVATWLWWWEVKAPQRDREEVWVRTEWEGGGAGSGVRVVAGWTRLVEIMLSLQILGNMTGGSVVKSSDFLKAVVLLCFVQWIQYSWVCCDCSILLSSFDAAVTKMFQFQMQHGTIGWSVGATLGYAQAGNTSK